MQNPNVLEIQLKPFQDKKNKNHIKETCQSASCKALRGEFKKAGHPNWVGSKAVKRKIYYCKGLDCMNQITYQTYSRGSGRCVKCFGKKHSLRMRGEKNPRYVSGEGRKPYPITFNEQLKDKIRVRDNFICQVCKISELEMAEKLCVHHVNYNKRDCQEGNLVAICRSCNTKVNNNRGHWIEYFRNVGN